VTAGDTADASLLIADSGTAAAAWSIDTTNLPAWLTLDTSSNTIPGEGSVTTVALHINTAGLAVTDYSAHLGINLGGNWVFEVFVTLHVVS
jgi:hypothetical protein